MSENYGPVTFDPASLARLCAIAEAAGREIMRFYHVDPGVKLKADQSPITLADRAAHERIVADLKSDYPQVPIISEEGHLPDDSERQTFERFWLVDPLDGTKEFIKRNDEFTVNIALIEGDRPVFGVVHAPTQNTTYYAVKGQGAWVRNAYGKTRGLVLEPGHEDRRVKVAVSRSHPNAELTAFLAQFPNNQAQPVGSSLKFCYIADTTIDLYPRFGPLCEWDTAAAHVVAEESGAIVSDLKGERLIYNKSIMKHQTLLVCRSQALKDRVLSFLRDK